VRRALKRYGSKTFWELISHKNSLADETRHYVPKIIAAAIVAKNREHYGFKVKPLSQLAWDEVTVDSPVELRRVARKLDTSVETLRTLNPALHYDVTPPRRRWTLRVPEGKGEAFKSWLAEAPKSQRVGYQPYVVQSGDTLSQIARARGSSIQAISQFNSIRNPRSLRPGQRLIIPTLRKNSRSTRPRVARKSTKRARKVTQVAKAAPQATGKPIAAHVVAAGDTLWSIAKRYGVSVQNLKRWNNRRSNRLSIGDVIRIFD
jgi:membrane-bound lytic murein transglycosylase D